MSTAAESTVEALLPLSPMDFYLLLALMQGDAHGYGIMKAVEEQSGGQIRPEIGSLYRMIGRLASQGLLEERPTPAHDEGDGRGRPRRYYGITTLGRDVARAEAARMRQALEVAESHDLLPAPDRA